jgi:hypothetical protein
MFEELLKNPLFLQMMSGAGQGLQSGQGISAGLDPIIQQTTRGAAQDKLTTGKMGLLQQILDLFGQDEGDPDRKITIGDEGITMKMGKSALAGSLGDAMKPAGMSMSPTAPAASATPSPTGGTQKDPRIAEALRHLGPSSGQQGIDYSAYAGLGPENVMAAWKAAFEAEGLSQQRMRDIVDQMYKGALTEESLARSEAAKHPKADPLDQPFPIPHPVLGDISMRQYQALPSDDKAYMSYVMQSQVYRPDDPIMDPIEFKRSVDKEDKLAYIKALSEEPELFERAKELKASGAMNLGELIERTKATTEARDVSRAKTDVTTGKVLVEVDKEMKDRGLDKYLPSDSEFISSVEERLKQVPPDIAAAGGEPAKHSQELQNEIIRNVRAEMEFEILDQNIRRKMQGSLGEGETIAIQHTDDGKIGWFLVKEDGSRELLIMMPEHLQKYF